MLMLILWSADPSRASEIIIDNSNFTSSSDDQTLEVTGIRQIITSKSDVSYDVQENIPVNVLVSAARQFPDVWTKVDYDPNNPASAIWSIKSALDNSSYDQSNLFCPDCFPTSVRNPWDFTSARPNTLNRTFAGIDPILSDQRKIMDKFWDPTTVLNLVATGGIDTSAIVFSSIDGKSVPTVSLLGGAKDKLQTVNYYLKRAEGSSNIREAGQFFNVASATVRNYDVLQKSMLYSIGRITFGKPLVLTAKEAEIGVPESIDRESNIFAIVLPVTFWDIDPNGIEELTVNFGLEPELIAIELFPDNLGTPVSQENKSGLPEMEMSVGDRSLKIGQFITTNVRYNFVKPTILALGVGEENFSWLVQGEAIRAGAFKFVAIIVVPKGRQFVDIAQSAHVRIKSDIWKLQAGGLAGTESSIRRLHF